MQQKDRQQQIQDEISKFVPFKEKYNFEQRQQEATKQLNANPTMVPLVVEWHQKAKQLKPLAKRKYLVERAHILADFQNIIRNKLDINKEDALQFFIGNKGGILTTPSDTLGDTYDKYKDEDGFLYLQYCDINPFGNE